MTFPARFALERTLTCPGCFVRLKTDFLPMAPLFQNAPQIGHAGDWGHLGVPLVAVLAGLRQDAIKGVSWRMGGFG